MEKGKPVIPIQGSSKDKAFKDKTCFECGGSWEKGHICKKNNINLIELDEEDTSGNDESDRDLAENDYLSTDDDSHSINMLEWGNKEQEIKENPKFLTDHLGQLVNIQDAEYSQLESPGNQTPCPAQCAVLVQDLEAVAVIQGLEEL